MQKSLISRQYQAFVTCSLFLLFGFLPLVTNGQTQILATNTISNWKVIRAATVPAGWTNFIYDETGWSPVVEVSQATCLDPHGQTPASLCGISSPIWASRDNTCSYPGDIVYFRKKFTVATGLCEPGSFILSVKCDNTSEIYINGNFVGTTNNNWSTGTSFSVPASFLKIGSNKNVIAVRCTDDGTTGWFSATLCKICS